LDLGLQIFDLGALSFSLAWTAEAAVATWIEVDVERLRSEV